MRREFIGEVPGKRGQTSVLTRCFKKLTICLWGLRKLCKPNTIHVHVENIE